MLAGADQPVTHIRTELRDVRLIFMQTELCLHPLVRLSFGHQAGAPQAVKSPVCLDTFMPKLPVSQRAHGLPCGAMGSHIAVASGIAVTNIQIASCTTTVAIYKDGRMQGSLSSAVGAMDIDSFQNVHLLLSACVRSLLADVPQLGKTAPFRVFYVPDKPAGVEALESLQRHNADAIIFIHGLTGQFLEYRHRDD